MTSIGGDLPFSIHDTRSFSSEIAKIVQLFGSGLVFKISGAGLYFERRYDQISQLPKNRESDFLKQEKARAGSYRTSMVGWIPIRRMRTLLIAFMFVVVVVATGSWLVHSVLIQVIMRDGSQHMQVMI